METVIGTRAGRREWLGLAVLALATLLVSLDIGVQFLALPHLSADLDATAQQQLWIMDIYGFMVAGFLITMGTLGDRIGRRRLLLIGAVAFAAASVLAAYSTNAGMLIAARALLGIAGATLNPSTLALISNMFRDERQRGLAISLWATCMFGGAALGPVMGGLLLEHFWWGSVFLAGLPVMAVLLVTAPFLLPEYRDANAGRLDLVSVLLSLGAILPIVYGVKELAVGGLSAIAAVVLVFGLAIGVWFVRRQLTLRDPLLDLALFKRPAFSAALGTMLLGGLALAGASLATSQYVQSVTGLSPRLAGLWQAPTGVGIAAGIMITSLLAKWLRPVQLMVGGMAVAIAGLLVLTRVSADTGPLVVAVAIAFVALGLGPTFVLGTGLVVGSVPPEKAGSAASISETSNEFGATMGLAVLGSVGAAVYQARVIVPEGVPPQAGQTIAEAVTLAARLPADVAAPLVDSARDAFTGGLNVVAAVAIALMASVALLARKAA